MSLPTDDGYAKLLAECGLKSAETDFQLEETSEFQTLDFDNGIGFQTSDELHGSSPSIRRRVNEIILSAIRKDVFEIHIEPTAVTNVRKMAIARLAMKSDQQVFLRCFFPAKN